MTTPLTGRNTKRKNMALQLLQYANREAVAKALTAGGYSVSRNTVNRWARGAEMPDVAARMVGELFGHSEAPRPDWTEGLANDVAMRVVAALLGGPEIPDAIERMREHLSKLPPPEHGVPPEGGGSPDPGTGAPRGRTVE